jgi:HK97 family phage prohead protease
MSDVLIRAVVSPLEVRGDGRTVTGLVCPYDQVARVNDGWGEYRECFDRGAFAKVMRGNPTFVRVHLEHPGQWVGRGECWLDSDQGLGLGMRLDDTEAGRTASFKIKDGQTKGLSIGFVPGRTRTRMHEDGPVEHRETIRTIHHVALCPQGAYNDARVTAVRSASHEPPERLLTWRQWLDTQNQ